MFFSSSLQCLSLCSLDKRLKKLEQLLSRWLGGEQPCVSVAGFVVATHWTGVLSRIPIGQALRAERMAAGQHHVGLALETNHTLLGAIGIIVVVIVIRRRRGRRRSSADSGGGGASRVVESANLIDEIVAMLLDEREYKIKLFDIEQFGHGVRVGLLAHTHAHMRTPEQRCQRRTQFSQ